MKRRKIGHLKSKQALLKGQSKSRKLSLADKTGTSKKREHCLTKNIKENVPVSKKAGRNMCERSTRKFNMKTKAEKKVSVKSEKKISWKVEKK